MIVLKNFEYVCFLAFENIMSYEDNRSLSISELHKFTMAFFDEIENTFGNPNPFRQDYDIDFADELLKFKNNNKNLFTFTNGKITLKNSVSFKDLEKIIFSYDELFKYKTVSKNNVCLEALNIHTIKDTLKSYFPYEKRLEQLYLELPYSEDKESIKSQIRGLSFLRELFYANVSLCKDYIIDAFIDESRMETIDQFKIDLLDRNLLKKLPVYNNEELIETELNSNLYSFLQYAIFSDGKLYKSKVAFEFDFFDDEYEDIDYEEDEYDECDESDEYSYDLFSSFDKEIFTEEDYNFYIKYLIKLDKYLSENDLPELLETKYRIIYALDRKNMKMYEQDDYSSLLLNYDKERMALYIRELLCIEVYFFIEELFNKEFDNNTVKKAMFISTYYEITHDDIIIKLLDKYKNNSIYPYVEEMILDDKNYELKLY